MSKIQHLLVATDGSEGSMKAAAFAGELARPLGARVTVITVLSEDVIMPYAWGAGEYPAGPVYGAMSIDEVRAMLEKRAREELPRTAEACGELPAAPNEVQIWGHPAEQICDYASEHAVDLIVIGSHGRSGFGRMLLGSVSNAVANHAPCPVTIVRG